MKLPHDFVSYTEAMMGRERYERFSAALDLEPPTSVRLNPSKGMTADGPRVPWCEHGRYLDRRHAFTFDPLLHAGCYYVQEASSMFIHHVARQLLAHRPSEVLDMCAAPGGKSTALAGALPEGSLLVSNEPVRQRAQVLLENVCKWGHPNHFVTCCYPRDVSRSGRMFDAVLCDVPCSGEGMFRKEPFALEQWSLQYVDRCQALQRQIVAEAWQCLRPGGLLVYSTCTYNTRENEENVLWMQRELVAETVPVATRPEWNITGSLLEGCDAPVMRFIPGFTLGEGLFMCVLRKPGADGPPPVATGQGKAARASRGRGAGDTAGVLGRLAAHVVPPPEDYPRATGAADALPIADVDYATAIGYLRRQAMVLPPDVPRGLVRISFRGAVLGLAKNIGTRANNLYPHEWRIKSTHIPTDYETILRPA